MEAKELIIVIPAYEPDHLLPELIDKLNEYFTGHQMIVINAGSKGKDELFEQVKNKENVTLLTHEVNRGKGAALKTAFAYIKTLGESYVIVTADSDGQHKPEDIYRVYNFYKKYNQGLVLGSRKFDGDIIEPLLLSLEKENDFFSVFSFDEDNSLKYSLENSII